MTLMLQSLLPPSPFSCPGSEVVSSGVALVLGELTARGVEPSTGMETSPSFSAGRGSEDGADEDPACAEEESSGFGTTPAPPGRTEFKAACI